MKNTMRDEMFKQLDAANKRADKFAMNVVWAMIAASTLLYIFVAIS